MGRNMKTKKSKILITLVLLVLAVVCAVNVTYSYFTSTAIADGDIVFGDLNVRFAYRAGDNILPTDKTTISLYPVSGTIEREVPFQLSLTEGGSAMENLIIQKYANTCACYVRFWVDAYVMDEVKNGDETTYVVNKTVNYGRYFFLTANESYYTKSGGSVSDSWCYFIVPKFPDNSSVSISLGNTLVLKDVSTLEEDKVPVTLLGEKLKITLTLEAVQSANKAYKSVFGDSGDIYGYYSSWV